MTITGDTLNGGTHSHRCCDFYADCDGDAAGEYWLVWNRDDDARGWTVKLYAADGFRTPLSVRDYIDNALKLSGVDA